MPEAHHADLAAEQALVERARADPDAFGALYDRYVDRIYRFAFHRTGGHADAEDVTAQTFHRAFERIGAYEWRGVPFGAWLFRIARNALVDRTRRGHAVSLDQIADGEPAADDAPCELALEAREALDEVWAAVAQLAPMQRRAVTLYYGRDLSHAEVGRRLGRSEAAAKQLVYRAIKTLRGRLATEEVEDAD